jgi:allantoate deiminase
VALTADYAATVLTRTDLLGAISEEVGRLVRRPLTTAAREAENRVGAWMAEAGATVTRDAVGNVFGRREGVEFWGSGSPGDRGRHTPGSSVRAHDGGDPTVAAGGSVSTTAASGPVLVIGSHIDTVRDAGKYDGPLGVALGIAAMAHVAAREVRGHPRLPFALEVAAFAGEEGVRFAAPFLGSRVATGTLPSSWLDRTDDAGITLACAIREAGGDTQSTTSAHARYRPGTVIAYLEPHIEQGPVLDLADEALGIVPAIVGQARVLLTFTGQANHAGTTPMTARRDALAGAATTVVAVERVAQKTQGLVATVGEIAIAPGAANVVPGAATLTIDVRHADDDVRRGAVERILDAAGEAAAVRSLDLAVAEEFQVAATPCDERVTGAIRSAATRLGMGQLREVMSGAGHDAMVMAAVAPVGMLFVRSPGGISHHPAEAVIPEDVHAAFGVLVATIDEIAMQVRAGSFPAPQEITA